ncbi:MAG: FtsX-like permease family protein [Alphaproteobacteria bacterium]|nr:FtsX-like permease family protein [Alphaproteobacteria bacterium]
MSALDRKLLRDLWRLRGQVLAIALIIASGIAVLVMSLSAVEALDETAVAYYERYRFADVFANVKRAPERLVGRIAALPGVQAADARITELAIIDLEEVEQPVLATFVSIPERRAPILNRLALRQGRLVAPGRADEIVVSAPFAEAHGLMPGDQIRAILNGHRRDLQIVGIALSPEFAYAIGPGSLMPDDRLYGIIWMGHEALASAYDLDGAFNTIALSLLPNTGSADVIDRLDRLLAPYGGIGAYDRDDQISNWFLMNEIDQLRNMAGILPTIFLAVAAFLTNMVMSRLIATERGEIGLLKAFGYGNLAVAWLYIKMVIVIVAIGIAVGWVTGFWMGRWLVQAYGELFSFPFLLYRPGPNVFAIAALVSLAAALFGTIGAVRRAAALPPAEAMQPPAPPLYRRTGITKSAFARWLDQPTRIILRQVLRWPVRSLLTSFGIAAAVAVLITALQWNDVIDRMVDFYFFRSQHQDVTVGLVEPQSSAVIGEFARMPGVGHAEPMRFVSVRFRVGNRTHRESIQGITPDARLSVLYDTAGNVVRVPPEGLVLSTKLAEILGVGRGDAVQVEVLEGRRAVRQVPVVDLFETYIGTPAYMDLAAVNRLMRERPATNIAHLTVDPAHAPALFANLKDQPKVSAVLSRRAAVNTFNETMGEVMLTYVGFFVVFSCTLAFGVVYNSARIMLSERGRELATLRVLGFSRADISYILLGEVALLTFVALPLGCAAGYGLVWLIANRFETELFRVPMVILPSTYGWAMLIGLAATAVSAAIVRRRIDRLDLIAVLKTRE